MIFLAWVGGFSLLGIGGFALIFVVGTIADHVVKVRDYRSAKAYREERDHLAATCEELMNGFGPVGLVKIGTSWTDPNPTAWFDAWVIREEYVATGSRGMSREYAWALRCWRSASSVSKQEV